MIDATQMLINLSNTLGPIDKMLAGSAYVLGVSFAFKAVFTLKVYGEARTMTSQHGNIKEPIMYFCVAAVFMFLPTGVSLVMQTTFGYSNLLAYSEWPSGGGSNLGPGMVAILRLLQVIGLFAFIRGWLYISKSQSQGSQGGFSKGLTHIIGGIAAMNIIGTARVISATLGVNL